MGTEKAIGKLLINGCEFNVTDFSITDFDLDKNNATELKDSLELNMSFKINWFNRVKIKAWLWLQSFKTYTFTCVLRGKNETT